MKIKKQNRSGRPSQVGLGIVGCGMRPRGLFRLLAGNDSNPSIQIRALFDPNADQVTKAKEELKCPNAIIHESYENLLKDPSVDWVLISSPNHLHAEQVIRAFHAGKNVFCEKPLATSFEDCLKMEKAWKKSGKEFFFGLCLRYSPLYQRVAQLLEEGVVGKIVSFEFNETLSFNHGGYIMGNWRSNREKAGTHLLEKCCHDIDLVQWFTGSVPVRVASFGGLDFFVPKNKKRIHELGVNSEGKSAYMVWDDPNRQNPFSKEISIVDNQVMIAEFDSGSRCSFHTNCNAAIPERRFYIVGTHGTLRADLYTGTIEWQKIGFYSSGFSEKIDLSGGHGGADEKLIEAFIETLLKGKAPAAGMKEAKLSAIACFGIDQAMDRKEVVDLRPLWKKAEVRLS
ncbi:MAG: Gfo/Idh/MocA family oxidoreductase [Verrucomicrobiota bacterium]